MSTAGGRSQTLLSVLLCIAAVPLLLAMLLVLAVMETQWFGTHLIDRAMTTVHLDDLYLSIYHFF